MMFALLRGFFHAGVCTTICNKQVCACIMHNNMSIIKIIWIQLSWGGLYILAGKVAVS